jgi:hypothetical protein
MFAGMPARVRRQTHRTRPGVPFFGKSRAATAAEEIAMVIVFIGCLIAVAAYLAKRLSDANTENVALRGQVSSLKRKLGKNR